MAKPTLILTKKSNPTLILTRKPVPTIPTLQILPKAHVPWNQAFTTAMNDDDTQSPIIFRNLT